MHVKYISKYIIEYLVHFKSLLLYTVKFHWDLFFLLLSKALFDLAILKKRVKEKEEKKKKKLKVIKSEVEDLVDSLSNADGIPPISQDPSPIPLSAVKEE